MELRSSKEPRKSIESLPEEIWFKIFEIGVSQKNKFTIKDISSLLVTCKFFNKLWSQDTLWSLLVTLDFPQFANDAGSKSYSSSKKALYKYGLARHCKHKFVYYHHQLERLETDIRILSERIERLDNRIKKATDDLELEMGALREAVDQGMVGLASALAPWVKDMITAQQNDVAKYRKRDELMRFFVDLQEGCEKRVRCLQSCLVELCTGSNPIELEDLWVPGDKIEDDKDYVKENVEVEDDYVDVDTTDDEDDDGDEDEDEDEDGDGDEDDNEDEDEDEDDASDNDGGDENFFNIEDEEEDDNQEDEEDNGEANVEGAGDLSG